MGETTPCDARGRCTNRLEVAYVTLYQRLLDGLPAGETRHILVGAYWTAVVAEVDGVLSCGLSTTMRSESDHHHTGGAAVSAAGDLHQMDSRALAALATSKSWLEASIGMATINALLPKRQSEWVDVNAERVGLARGTGKRVALVGHFPFADNWRSAAAQLWVLELKPQQDDLPAAAAWDVIPQADVVAITGTALINHTFDELMSLCRPDASVMVLGPTTPLSPILFDYGVHLLSGAVVEDIEPVLKAVGQGANFRQVHRRGVRLVTMSKPGWPA